ncbi:Hypothetical_protein [Hexamita inflata]|uniref:Hypothetical_protein n=1 Tax=Hexamita inflata TaxID=28002 RepID=A0AA86TT31_9EUKA|nr:Hypothetical protein HINF_LOCUS13397 [Hexamita inflata]
MSCLTTEQFSETETIQLFNLETPSRSTINVQLPMLCIIEQLADFPQIKSQLHQGTHLDQYPQPFSDQQEASFPIDMSRISLQMRQIAQGLCLVRIDDKYVDYNIRSIITNMSISLILNDI